MGQKLGVAAAGGGGGGVPLPPPQLEANRIRQRATGSTLANTLGFLAGLLGMCLLWPVAAAIHSRTGSVRVLALLSHHPVTKHTAGLYMRP